ncbi:MFS transporter [Legionella maioricensis]|uniref:MFS transporter n=1 Tax=Legionella maioricensis TaxID=2896528 RepID=A0A9X2CZU0_9GAMM|nr:MFS transporter [Legionella maioricensis]MCL9683598.1 MFS transporter [Legionella maioricensis]MCL9686897.1 MFS transporter [Legionella maioricensis]
MTKLIKKYFTGLSKNTVFLALASLFSDISTEMLYPLLPVFLVQTLQASGSVVGLIEGIAQATQSIAQGFSGWLSDKLQKRKAIALVGYLLAAIAKPLIGASTFWSDALGARFLDRLSAGTRSAPRDALIASSVAKEHRGKAFGLEGIGDNLGACLGPLLTILLLTFLQVDIRYIFYLAVIPGFLAFFMILFVKEKSVKVSSEAKLEINFRQFPKAYWKYLLVTALFCLGNSSNAFLILQTQNMGISLETTIVIYAGFNLVAALISYPTGFLSDELGRKNILLASFLIFFISYIGFALINNVILIAVLFIFYGLYQGIFRSVGKALATDLIPEHLHASGLGWYSTIIGLLELVASIVAGLLWDHVSHTAVFLYGAVFAIVGSMALLWMIPSDQSNDLGRI